MAIKTLLAAAVFAAASAQAQSIQFEGLERSLEHKPSLRAEKTQAAFLADKGLRVAVSLEERRVIVAQGNDTLLVATAAVATGESLEHGSKTWRFILPEGKYRVRGKRVDPIWTPPLWHYAEVARDHGLTVERLVRGRKRYLEYGSYLETRGRQTGLKAPGEPWLPMDEAEEIVFDGIIFIPPAGTEQSVVHGALGAYALDLGNGYMLHGTPDKRSIGRAATHGCVRLGDDDIEWLFAYVDTGSRVYVY